MKVEITTEQSIQVLNTSINNLATKANIERKLLIRGGRPRAAESIGALMVLIWKLFRSCKELHAENVRLREESMNTKELRRETARTMFEPVAKAHLN